LAPPGDSVGVDHFRRTTSGSAHSLSDRDGIQARRRDHGHKLHRRVGRRGDDDKGEDSRPCARSVGGYSRNVRRACLRVPRGETRLPLALSPRGMDQSAPGETEDLPNGDLRSLGIPESMGNLHEPRWGRMASCGRLLIGLLCGAAEAPRGRLPIGRGIPSRPTSAQPHSLTSGDQKVWSWRLS
jgi:hypothetical protein